MFFALAAAADGPLAPTNELWSLLIQESSDTCPAIAPDGTIYLGTFWGKLWAIAPGGTKKWIFRAGREIKSSPALGSDGTVYFGCRDRKFYAVSPQGKRKWAFLTGGWVDSSPAVAADGTLYFGSWDNSFYALRPDGGKKWHFETGAPIVSSPAIGKDGTIYFGSHDRKFYALRPDGTKAWDYAAGGPITSSPAIDADGTLYFTSVNGVFHALNSDGTRKWHLKTGGITESSPIIGQDGTLYVGVNEALWAIEHTGQKKWDQPWRTGIKTSPLALSDGSVWFLSGYGTLINLRTPEERRAVIYLAQNGFGPAVAANGTLYALWQVENVGYELRALDWNLPLANSPWPKFRGSIANTGRSAP